VVVLHQGKVLAEGRPAEVSGLAAGRTFLAQPPAGRTARGLQAHLLGDPQIVDAVQEGGQVRLVRSAGKQQVAPVPGIAAGSMVGATVSAVQPRFEDGFMILLRRAATVSHPERSEGSRPDSAEIGRWTGSSSSAPISPAN
jgi:ABC-2 type transport system ATP-binding protein